MKNVKEIVENKKFFLIINLIRLLHRENLEIIRMVLLLNMNPKMYNDTFFKLEKEWEGIIEQTIHEGLHIKEEDLDD